MKTLVSLLLVSAVLTGCATATSKDWSATGGSRADGVVRLSFEYTEFETPVLNEGKALELAGQRCKSWGYTGAEAFGGSTKNCNMRGGWSGCASWLVTKEYQCNGTGADTAK